MTNTNILKDAYKDYFKIGAACEHTSERFPNNEIGNPDKENLIRKHFNSITFANELKPMYNMGFKSENAKEDYLPFVINSSAKEMLDWAVNNKLSLRGHVLLWHSQCPKEIFCKNYEAVTFPTDPEELKEKPFLKYFEKLNPVCYVDRDTLLKRLKTYIFSLMEYMYSEGYATTIYAWDVVNEAIELEDHTETGLRNTYWYQIIGDDLIYWAFKYANEAVCEMSVKYSDRYEGNIVRPALFYNDYNEFQPAKQTAIIAALEREGHGHGSIISEGLIDGIGMQGHLSDNNDIEEYKQATIKYGRLVKEIHITELDVKCTCNNKNAFYYQAVFYKKLFKALLEARNEGANITCVTFWGLTDDNSWIRGANPLLFNADLSKKMSYDAVLYALTGGDLGQPEKIDIDLSDRYISFEPTKDGKLPELADLKLKQLGDGKISISDKKSHSGSYSLYNELRFGAWCGIGVDVTDFIGQTISFKAFVSSPAKKVLLRFNNEFGDIVASAETGNDDWSPLEGTFRIPTGVHSMYLFFGTEENEPKKFSPVFADDIEIKLVGLKESFEDKSHVFAIRGMGHLPVLEVTDRESVDRKSHSLHVTRAEKDATVKFDVSPYIGHKINISLFVKTKDSVVRIGIDGPKGMKLTEINSASDVWNRIDTEAALDSNLNSAEIYIETDSNGEIFIDDVNVTLAD